MSEELGLDPWCVWGWGFAKTVRAAFLVREDGVEIWDQALECAELLAAIEP